MEWRILLSAAGTTLSLALSSLFLGLILAIVFTLWENIPVRLIAWTGSLLVTILRGLPEILIVLSIYFGTSQILPWLSKLFNLSLINDVNVHSFLCGVISLSLLYAAYASQTLRGALKAVPKGQSEAGAALGISKRAIFLYIVIPQMWRHALPGLGNQWLVLLKDTALVSLIGINDLMLQAKNIAVRTQEPFTWYTIAATIYLLITLISQTVLKKIEKKTTYFEHR